MIMWIKLHATRRERALALVVFILILVTATTRLQAQSLPEDMGTCGGASVTLPFTDVPAASIFFCSIASVYYSGLTGGTSATTYAPLANVTREQMAAFLSRTLTQSLRRGSRRAALEQLASPTSVPSTGTTTVGNSPNQVKSDGADLWVANSDSSTVSRVRASDGKLLETWTGADNAHLILIARGRVFVAGNSQPKLYVIDPKAPAGAATLLTGSLPDFPQDMAFDGFNIWVATADSVSKVNPNTGAVTTYTGITSPSSITFDGTFMWVSEGNGTGGVRKVDLNGNIIQTISTGAVAVHSVFDGVNLWVPTFGGPSITVVRVCDSFGNPVASPFVLATLTGNGLNTPFQAAFDGERIAVTNNLGNSISLWRAADFTPLGVVTGATNPVGICSDGLNFWIVLDGFPGKLARF
jgi:S-layer family protein